MHLHAKISDVRWKYVNTNMLIARNGTLVNLTDRCEIFLNGSLKFNEGLKRDSGIYTVQQFSENGDCLSERRIELSILGELFEITANFDICYNLKHNFSIRQGSFSTSIHIYVD